MTAFNFHKVNIFETYESEMNWLPVKVEVTVTDIKMSFIFAFYQRFLIQKVTVYTTTSVKVIVAVTSILHCQKVTVTSMQETSK